MTTSPAPWVQLAHAALLGVALLVSALLLDGPLTIQADVVRPHDVQRRAGPVGCASNVVVVGLHPWSSSAAAYMRSVRYAVGPACAQVVTLDGPLPEGSGRAWLRTMARSPQQALLAREAEHSADELAARLQRWGRLGARLVVTGHSQGAIVGWTLAARHLELRARYVLSAGMLPGVTIRPGDGEVHAVHGRADTHVPVARAREGAARLSRAGRRVVYRELETGHNLRDGLYRTWTDQLRAAVAAAAAGPQ
ncbi:MAG: hypothetical protein H6726_18030 [Sandaracinaceae bacterium]|nr:hypothetical protein [Myxococcales bacterium]MCB9659550.1 hypothetical protein [Sandaracinaceae bacterium]